MKKRRHHTGQLSIFIILLFPVLFVLFAISLNIVLVVHDKINLQNSVDISAYYGAMKQAEMLNAIAHINYQIRQNYKLLAWRYRVLGSVSLTNTPYKRAYDNEGKVAHTLPNLANRSSPSPYMFCVAHKYWDTFINHNGDSFRFGSDSKDHICLRMGESATIRAPVIPPVVGVLGGLSSTLKAIRRTGITVAQKLKKDCDLYGYNSWFLGAWTFAHFRSDHSDRQHIIYQLAKTMSGDGKTPHEHGTDLDGASIAEGVKKTFEKNLTFINKEAFKGDPTALKQFNSLQKSVNNSSPKYWLRNDKLWHVGLYSKIQSPSGACKRGIDYLYNPPYGVANNASVKSLINNVLNNPGTPWPSCSKGSLSTCEPTAGLYKNREYMIFYGVKAELDYKNQIFLPFGRGKVKLKARAFAKPFGGTIGPNQEPGSRQDRLLPHQINSEPISSLMDIDKHVAPNYSRYPTDKLGLRSPYVHYYWSNHIKRSGVKNVKFYSKYNHIDDKDPLAKGEISPSTGILARKWELAAISPDLFDVTYFTILPYYMHTYFPKIKNLLSGTSAFNALRGDLGTFKQGTDFVGPSILNQIGGHPRIPSEWELIHSSTQTPPPTPNKNKPWYKITDLKLLLTGWNPPKTKYHDKNDIDRVTLGLSEDSGVDYGHIKNSNFGHCNMWVHDPRSGVYVSGITGRTSRGKIATGCIYGGRMGYSVKLVSGKFIQQYANTDISLIADWF